LGTYEVRGVCSEIEHWYWAVEQHYGCFRSLKKRRFFGVYCVYPRQHIQTVNYLALAETMLLYHLSVIKRLTLRKLVHCNKHWTILIYHWI
jgi:hypothetical protein